MITSRLVFPDSKLRVRARKRTENPTANRYRALLAIATGIIFFVSSVYGLAIGYFALLPITIIVLLAIALQEYIWSSKSSGDLSIRSFLWALMPCNVRFAINIYANSYTNNCR